MYVKTGDGTRSTAIIRPYYELESHGIYKMIRHIMS
jgi:hypothetical protein